MFELEIFETVNILALILGTAFGMVAQKQQFCFSGSIKDYILTKSTKRASSVIMAMIVAVIATSLMSTFFEIDLTETNFYKDDINYFIIIFGASLFGIGMFCEIVENGLARACWIIFRSLKPFSRRRVASFSSKSFFCCFLDLK